MRLVLISCKLSLHTVCCAWTCWLLLLRSRGAGQEYLDRGADALAAFDTGTATGLLGETENLRQAEARAFAEARRTRKEKTARPSCALR